MDSTSLPALVDELLSTAHSARSGRAAHTLHGNSHNKLRQTVIALTAGSVLAEHQGPGEATLHVLRGHVTLTAGDQSAVGIDGDVLSVPLERHELSVQHDSAVLLTVVKDGW
ncbi:LuxR family transcriptional regulator [Gordonia bronchialis]|uniref:LuxR family transcriptional regulator n=1 Tax=Gordonia bronchialis TaxID=2054 RepID=UPI00242AF5C4|nr:LuxR family transcriptional regulator [Gordonia bronchialis]